MSFEFRGLSEFSAALSRITAQADAGSKRAIARGAAEVEKVAKENASGAPGPEVVTGTLRRGVRHTTVHRVGLVGWQSEVGPTVIYSRRIDLGFIGADSLGRIYKQQPRPFFTSAWASVVSRLPRIYAEEWAKALSL